jgi:hypothetical protein
MRLLLPACTLLVLLAGELLRHLLPIAPPLLLLLLLLLSASASKLSAIMSSSVSIAASGLPLLLLLLPLAVLLLVLTVGLGLSLSRVRIMYGGNLVVDLLSDLHAVSFNSCTALLTSSCLRCCGGRFGGKFCTALTPLLVSANRPVPLLDAAGGCAAAGAQLLLLVLAALLADAPNSGSPALSDSVSGRPLTLGSASPC